MLHNPFFIEVSRPTGRFRTLELIPIYQQESDHYIATRNFRIYAGYETDEHQQYDGDSLRDQYFDNLELMGDDNPCYLGQLNFEGFGFYEWRYVGHRLGQKEVWQIVDLLQNCVRVYVD